MRTKNNLCSPLPCTQGRGAGGEGPHANERRGLSPLQTVGINPTARVVAFHPSPQPFSPGVPGEKGAHASLARKSEKDSGAPCRPTVALSLRERDASVPMDRPLR